MKISDLFVLLVEPSNFQNRLIEGLLRELQIGNITSISAGGQAALEQMRQYKPDLVISSLYLPDMTGTDLVTEMRGTPGLEDIAFMLISSETRFRVLDPIRQAGAIALLPKPFKLEDLRVALNATVDLLDEQELSISGYEPEELNVLLVDDSALARKHMRRVLEGMGIERFSEASDGNQALEMMQNNFFDLVVTDYNMPNMDGKELVDHIRSGTDQSSVPILMVTSEQDQQRIAAVQQAGVSAVCDKPFLTGSVKSMIQQMLNP